MKTLVNNLTNIINASLTPNSSFYNDEHLKDILSNVVKYIRDDNSIKLHTPTRINSVFGEYLASYADVNIYYNNEDTIINITFDENVDDDFNSLFKLTKVEIVENKKDILDIETLLK